MSYDAYYYSFEPTGNDAVDMILQAVAAAGKGCHHTEDWREYGLDKDIQDAANNAAALLSARATPPAPTPAAAEGQAEARLKYNLRELLGRLPIRRDWLNPDVERELRAIESEIAPAAAPLPRQAAVRGEDAARLDWLEQRGNDGGLLLHAGNQDTGGHSGLGLINTGRTLRQAVDSARGVKTVKSAPAPTVKASQ